MTEEGCLPLPSPYPFDAFREGRKRGESVRPFKFLVQAPSRWCNLPPWLIPSPFLPFNPSSPLFIPFLPAHRCNLWTGSGRRRDRREGEEGGGSDKSLVVKRGDHGGREGRERRGGEGVQSFARRGFHPWNRIVFFHGGGNSGDMDGILVNLDKRGPVFFNMGMLVGNVENFLEEILMNKWENRGKLIDRK